MPKYRITAPDGGTYEVTAPEGASEAEVLAYAQQNYQSAAKPKADFSDVQSQVSTKGSAIGQVKRQAGLGARAMLKGAYSLPGIVLDPIMQAAGLPNSAQAADQHADFFGLPRPGNGAERVSGDITSALTGGGGFMGAGRQLAMRAPGVVQRVGETMASQPVSQLAGMVAGSGAAGTTREAGGGRGAQALAGLAGGLSPAAGKTTASMGLRGLIRGRQTPDAMGVTPMQGRINDFRSVGANPSVGQAAGNGRMQGAESLLAGAPTSQGVMARFAEKQADQIGGGLQDRAESMFRNASAERAGNAVREGAETFAGNVKATRKALYWQADRYIPGDTPLPLQRTQMALAELTTPNQGAMATTGGLINPKIATMAQNVADDLAANQGAMPYEAVKALRSRIGEELSDYSLSADRPTAQYKRLYAALSQDLEDAARKMGPAAEAAAKRANNYTRASADRLDLVERVVDKNGGPEKIYAAVMAGTRDGGTTLRAVMQSLPKDGQRAVTGAVIKRMGLAMPNQQDMDGGVFSAQTFLTNWNKVSPEAKRALFDRHGPKFVKDMDKVARVAANIKDGAKVFANPPGTANRLAAYSYWASLPAAAAAAPFTGPGPLVGLVLGGISANVAARAMTNPKFVSWLARTTEMPVSALPQSLVTLKAIGRDDPDVAELAESLEQGEHAVDQQGY